MEGILSLRYKKINCAQIILHRFFFYVLYLGYSLFFISDKLIFRYHGGTHRFFIILCKSALLLLLSDRPPSGFVPYYGPGQDCTD